MARGSSHKQGARTVISGTLDPGPGPAAIVAADVLLPTAKGVTAARWDVIDRGEPQNEHVLMLRRLGSPRLLLPRI